MQEIDRDAVQDGQRVYSRLTLPLYDLWVLGISNHWLWRCPTAELRGLYDRNIGARHLDIGVGTGYFLKHAAWPVERPEITLVDLNPASLAAASARIGDRHPRTVLANALEPLPDLGTFDSVGLCYLLHCLPGGMADKAAVLDHVKPLLAPGGRVFGATILPSMADGAPPGWAANRLMAFYNSRGIFSNGGDRPEELEAVLRSRFDGVQVVRRGCVALFEARAGGSAGASGAW